MQFSKRLKELRISKGMTQIELAKRIGSNSRSTISQYESGKREPNYETLEALADVFNVTLSFMMGEESASPDINDANGIRERLRRQPGFKLLFYATENASEEEMKRFARMIEVWRGVDNDSGA